MDRTRLTDLESQLSGYLLDGNELTSDQLDEAVEYQTGSGGTLAGHLFRLGYVGEADLVQIFNDRLGCKAVALSGLDVAPSILESIPAEIAWSRTIFPFEMDPVTNTLKIACLNPDDRDIRQAVTEVNPDCNIELYFALETTLLSAITRHYRQPVVKPDVDEPEEMLDIDSILPDVIPDSAPVINPEDSRTACRLLVLSGNSLGAGSLGRLLQHQGYHVHWTESLDAFIEAYLSDRPAIILILAGPGLSPVPVLVDQLNRSGITLARQPVFLVAGDINENQMGKMLQLGFEDVVRVENILDLLLIKLSRVRERFTAERDKTVELVSDLGTHGTLVDMNAIDLLQAMNRSGKTVRMSITGHGGQLTIYIRQGQVVAADNGDLIGPEAIYDALAWRQGVWNVDPIPIKDLPEPNNRLTTEAILLEGCRRLDEQVARAAGSEFKREEPDPGSLTTRLNIMFDNL
jgi:hypothetical protein